MAAHRHFPSHPRGWEAAERNGLMGVAAHTERLEAVIGLREQRLWIFMSM